MERRGKTEEMERELKDGKGSEGGREMDKGLYRHFFFPTSSPA